MAYAFAFQSHSSVTVSQLLTNSGSAEIAARVEVTPQAQNIGTSPSLTVTASPKSGLIREKNDYRYFD